MTDDADLVQRLRRTYRKEFAATGSIAGDISNRLRPFPILATEVLFNPDGREAADRIEAQAAEIERLNKSAECLAETRRLAVKDIAVLEAENERLREVLEFYAGWGVTNPVYDTVVILDGGKKARAELEQTK
jgi:hypothetical protein